MKYTKTSTRITARRGTAIAMTIVLFVPSSVSRLTSLTDVFMVVSFVEIFIGPVVDVFVIL